MNRREFLAGMGAGVASMAFAGCTTALVKKTPGRDRPNILVIMSDEHNASVTGCYGNSIIQTPNLDRLAAGGTTFESCYCNSPLCVPSRLSFTAGKYVSRIGAWSNDCRLDSDDVPSLPRILTAAGYESYLCGKMHYDRTRRYGFTEIGGNRNNGFKTGKGGRRKPGRWPRVAAPPRTIARGSGRRVGKGPPAPAVPPRGAARLPGA